VTRKITRGLARIRSGLDDCLYLGNLDALRDWGHAKDYVLAQWLMLQQKEARDYVIATGQQHSVREFIEAAVACLGIALEWQGSGLQELGVVTRNDGATGPQPGAVVVRIDPRYFRPTEVESLLGDASKARRQLGWVPRTSFTELVEEMVRGDLQIAQRDALSASEGFRIFQHHE